MRWQSASGQALGAVAAAWAPRDGFESVRHRTGGPETVVSAFFEAAAAGDLEGALARVDAAAWLAVSAEAPVARRPGGPVHLPASGVALTRGRRGIERYLRLVRHSFWREPLAVAAGERASDPETAGFAAAAREGSGPGREAATEWYGVARVHGGLIRAMLLVPLPWRTVVPASRAAAGATDSARRVARALARRSLPAAPPATHAPAPAPEG